jgi:cephalosporin-C deacetylase-like acetyl esterase
MDYFPPIVRPAARGLVPALITVAILAACGGVGTDASRSGVASGSPSASASFDYAAGSVQPTLAPQATLADGTTVQDLRFPSPRGGTASGWLVTPAGDGPFAGLVYLHGSETDRDDFLDEAMAMATVGVASVTLDAPFVREGASRTTEAGNYFAPDKEVAMMEQSVVDLRVAIDVLVASAHVDATRVGFVGHSWGASTGAILAAVDPRPVAFVLITARPSWTEYVRSEERGRLSSISKMLGPEKWAAYLAALAPFDAVAWLPRTTGTELLLQFGTQDDVVVPAAVDEFVAAAPADATVKRYPAGHTLDAAATADRAAWLATRLGVAAPSAAVLARVGLPDAETPLP